MSEPDTAGGALEFNPDARSAAYVFRAGSVLPADKVAPVEKRVALVSRGQEYFAFEPATLVEAFGEDVLDQAQQGTTLVARNTRVLSAVAKGAVPQLLRSIGTYNIVQFDGYFFGVPQSLGTVEWGVADLTRTPGVFVSQNMKSVVRQVEEALGIDRKAEQRARRDAKKEKRTLIPLVVAQAPAAAPAMPHLVGSLEAYNVVEYEGWYYGLPHELGSIDLTTTDVMEMPGVIRDLSRDVVEGEIRETRSRAVAAG